MDRGTWQVIVHGVAKTEQLIYRLDSGYLVCPEGKSCWEEQNALMNFIWFITPVPSWSMRGFFSNIHCEDVVDLLQVKITEVWGPWMTESPAGVFISQAYPHWASSSSSITVQDAFTRHWFLQRFLLWDVVFLWILLSLHQFWGQPFALWPHFYWSSKKSCWVFNSFSFFFYLFLGWIGGFPGGIRGKEPTGQCRWHKRHGFDPWIGRFPGERHGDTVQYSCLDNPMGFPHSSVGKESACNAGYPGSSPGLGRSPGEGIGYPLQYSVLENSMDSIVHGVAELDATEGLSLTHPRTEEPGRLESIGSHRVGYNWSDLAHTHAGWIGDFQASHLPGGKPEIPFVLLYAKIV